MGWHLSCAIFGYDIGIILFLCNIVSNMYGETLYSACHISNKICKTREI